MWYGISQDYCSEDVETRILYSQGRNEHARV